MKDPHPLPVSGALLLAALLSCSGCETSAPPTTVRPVTAIPAEIPNIGANLATSWELSDRARAREDRGDTIRAIADYTNALALGPDRTLDRARLYALRAAARSKVNDVAGAMEDFDQTLAIRPDQPSVYIARALLKQIKHDFTGALSDYDQAIALDPKKADVYLSRSSIRREVGDDAGALKDIDEAIRLGDKRPGVLAMRELITQHRHPATRVITTSGRLVRFVPEPSNAEGYVQRATYRHEVHDNRGAIDDADRAIALNPKLAIAWVARGAAKFESGEAAGALADFDQALALDPNLAVGYANRAWVKFYDQHDISGALRDCDQAIAIDHETGWFYRLRGEIKLQQADNPGALADLDRALALDPKDSRALGLRGAAKALLNDSAGALADLDLTLSLDPTNAVAYNNRAHLRADQGEYQEAFNDYARGATYTSEYITSRRGMLAMRYNLKDYARVITEASELLAIAPRDTIALIYRGQARYRSSDLSGALADYDAIEKFEPSFAPLYTVRATLNWARGDYAAALADIEKNIALDPAHSDYPRFFRHLLLRRLNRTATDDLASLAPKWKPGWPRSIGLFLTGQLSAKQFAAAAELAPKEKLTGQRCELHFYQGMLAFFDHRVADARLEFTACLATDATPFTEYQLAQAELARLPAPVSK